MFLETKLIKIALPLTNVYLKNWGNNYFTVSFGPRDNSESPVELGPT